MSGFLPLFPLPLFRLTETPLRYVVILYHVNACFLGACFLSPIVEHEFARAPILVLTRPTLTALRSQPMGFVRTLSALTLSLTLGCAALSLQEAQAGEVTVFAAASTTNALNDIAAAYGKTHPELKFRPSYASSSTLAKQIENGAPAQIFVSADEQWADYLDQRHLLAPGSRIDLLGNRLALVAPTDSKVDLAILPGVPLAEALGKDGRLAVGDPAHVPVGIYTEQALKALGIWSALENRLARADSVRGALAFVERDETPLGIVYTTDAAVTPKVRIVSVFPEKYHDPIRYPFAILAHQDNPEVKAFFEYLHSPEAREIWQKYGFLTL